MAYREHARAARVEAEFWQRTTFQLTGGAATGNGGASLSASPGGSAPAWGTPPQPTWAPPVPTWGPVATTGHLAQAGGGGGGAYPSPVGFPGPSQPMWTPPGPMWAAPLAVPTWGPVATTGHLVQAGGGGSGTYPSPVGFPAPAAPSATPAFSREAAWGALVPSRPALDGAAAATPATGSGNILSIGQAFLVQSKRALVMELRNIAKTIPTGESWAVADPRKAYRHGLVQAMKIQRVGAHTEILPTAVAEKLAAFEDQLVDDISCHRAGPEAYRNTLTD